jgi:asparagine synthase (glutamine-hydrolysing)
MPGIVGIIDKGKNEQDEFLLNQMLNAILHEASYSYGKFIYNDLGIYIGWCVHKNSTIDCMPITNESKNIILFFSGEDFQEPSIIDELKRKGHVFQDGNASYLVHLYEEENSNFFNKLNGKFNGLLIDKCKNKAFLFNDRYGFQRLYYYETTSKLFFSSEAKAILKICPECRKIRMDSLGQYFSMNCVLENKTLFDKVDLLPGASLWTIEKKASILKTNYFNLSDWENQPTISNELLYEQVQNTLIRILPKYFNPNEKIGLSLTGGFDTRIILANRKNPPNSFPCYTFGGMYRDCYDVKVARKVAAACRQQHQTLKLDENFLSTFPELAKKVISITDGALDISGVQDLYLNIFAKEVAPIRMTGNYGQEVFRASVAFKPNLSYLNLFKNDFIPDIRIAQETYNRCLAGKKLSFTLFKQAPWFQYGRYKIEESQLVVRSPYMDNDLVKILFQAQFQSNKNKDLSIYLVKNGQNKELARIITDRGYLGTMPSVISKLKRFYYEFTFKMEYISNFGMPLKLSKANLLYQKLHLEKLFIERHKFHHLGLWLKNELSTFVKDILFDDKTLSRSYINKKEVVDMVNNHIAGTNNHTGAIIKLISSELIYRHLIES